MIRKKCHFCNNIFYVPLYRKETAKFCSISCKSKHTGKLKCERAEPILWAGYMRIKKHGHYRADKQGYVKIADLVAEKKIKRHLFHNEIVHHIDGVKTNDHPDNLEVMDKTEHDKMETTKRWRSGNFRKK